jgi:hypothetical protein
MPPAARRTADGTGPVSVSPDGSVGSGGNGFATTGREAREACEGRAAGSANESNLLREVENVRAVDQNGPVFLNFMCIKLSARDLAKSVKLLIKPLTVLRDFVGGREHRINSAVRDNDFYSVSPLARPPIETGRSRCRNKNDRHLILHDCEMAQARVLCCSRC